MQYGEPEVANHKQLSKHSIQAYLRTAGAGEQGCGACAWLWSTTTGAHYISFDEHQCQLAKGTLPMNEHVVLC
jgi:hypothetical protein